MKKMFRFLAAALLLGTLPAAAFDMGGLADAAAKAGGVSAKNGGLVSDLVSQLGVTPSQATGGVAALLGSAKQKMPAQDFSKLTASVPELGTLLNSGAAAGLAQGLSLDKQFAALGLDPSMIGKFTPIIMQYVQKLAGPEVSQLLAAAL